LRDEGIRVGWISSRPSTATTRRAEELKIDFVLQEGRSKTAAVELLIAQTGVEWEEICYVGDDIVDLGPMRQAGLAVAVANAVPEVKEAAHLITRTTGGSGAVREIAEAILKAQNKWAGVVAARAQ
jgi:3-deoxy-D-manno-octulosonate 8-phosphate phosphatase (KDO 8-P phosphatase)